MQHIEEDTNDPRIWDVANSKILNIQIVDSHTFQLVTGLNPPASPITADMYHRLGLPFFRAWRDEAKGPGVTAPPWSAGIKGVAETAVANMTDVLRWQDARHLGNESDMDGEADEEEWNSDDEQLGDGEIEDANGGQFCETGEKDVHLDFPVVLLDVDDTLPKFVSRVAERDTDEPGEEDDGMA